MKQGSKGFDRREDARVVTKPRKRNRLGEGNSQTKGRDQTKVL
jgi:hypothetical protein